MASRTVLVESGTGVIPLESLSQGTLAAIGWAWVLLDRLYKAYPHSVAPERERALVLIDEIDAHMHPAWQQTMIGRLQRVFRRTQFIVTTHSPLVVGGVGARTLAVLSRQGTRTTVKAIRDDLSGWRADQILTSDLFGLSSSRSDLFQALLSRYLSTASLTDKPTASFPDTLKFRSQLRQLRVDPFETEAARQASADLSNALKRRWVQASNTKKKAWFADIERQFGHVFRDPGEDE